MNVENHLALLLRPIFPADMEIRRIDKSTSELIFRVHKKCARKIEVRFDEAVVEDYRDDKTYRSTMDTFIGAHLRARFAEYFDDGVLDPALDWEVTPEVYLPEPLLPIQHSR